MGYGLTYEAHLRVVLSQHACDSYTLQYLNLFMVVHKVTLIIALPFCPKILGRCREPARGIFPLCEDRLGGRDIQIWWRHSNLNSCN